MDLLIQNQLGLFNRKMASTDKSVRDVAVQELAVFLFQTESINLEQVVKLWVGLFYGYWMSDKPLVQQDLADGLSEIITLIQPERALLYIEAFWKVHIVEWFKLDRIRTDKFYLLMRRVVGATFQMFKDRDYDLKLIKSVKEIYLRTCLNIKDDKVPISIISHVITVYHQELTKVVSITEDSNTHYDTLMNTLLSLLSLKFTKPTILEQFENHTFPDINDFIIENQENSKLFRKHALKVKSQIYEIINHTHLPLSFRKFVQSQLISLNDQIIGGNPEDISTNPPEVDLSEPTLKLKPVKEKKKKQKNTEQAPKVEKSETKTQSSQVPSKDKQQAPTEPTVTKSLKRPLPDDQESESNASDSSSDVGVPMSLKEMNKLRNEKLWEVEPELLNMNSGNPYDSNLLVVPSTGFIVSEQSDEELKAEQKHISTVDDSDELVIAPHFTATHLSQIDRLLRSGPNDNPNTLKLDLPPQLAKFTPITLLQLDTMITMGKDADVENIQLGKPENRHLDNRTIFLLSEICFPTRLADSDEEDEEDLISEEEETEDSDENSIPESPTELLKIDPKSVKWDLSKNTTKFYQVRSVPDLNKSRGKKATPPSKPAIKPILGDLNVSPVKVNDVQELMKCTIQNTQGNIIFDKGVHLMSKKRLRMLCSQ